MRVKFHSKEYGSVKIRHWQHLNTIPPYFYTITQHEVSLQNKVLAKR